MPKFHVISGSLIVGPKGKQRNVGLGGEVEFTEEQRQSVDPTGELLASPEAFAELKASAIALAKFEIRQKLTSSPSTLNAKLLRALGYESEEAKAFVAQFNAPAKVESKAGVK